MASDLGVCDSNRIAHRVCIARFGPLRPWPFFHADFGKEFSGKEFCGEVHPETAPLQVRWCSLYRTEHYSRGRTRRKGASKRGGKWVASKGGKKEKKDAWRPVSTREIRPDPCGDSGRGKSSGRPVGQCFEASSMAISQMLWPRPRDSQQIFTRNQNQESPRQTKPKKGPKRKFINFAHSCEFRCFSLGNKHDSFWTFVPECPREKFMNWPFFGLVCRGHSWQSDPSPWHQSLPDQEILNWTVCNRTNFGSARTDPVRFKWGFGEGLLKDKFVFFRGL